MKKIVILGGGAAGIFAAIHAAKQGNKVIVLEKTVQLLSKVRISGGGRCNVTHACFDPKELIKNYPRGSKALLGPFTRFGPQQTIEWFENHGIAFKTEADGRMFPATDSSQTIIDCLLTQAKENGVEILLGQSVQNISKNELGFNIQLKQNCLTCEKLILATGSSKQGYNFAVSLGHSVVDPVPSLFTLNIPTSSLLDLAGITIPHVQLELSGKITQSGPLLLTHWGFSGPAALKLSAWTARHLHDVNYKANLSVNWIPIFSFDGAFQKICHCKKEIPSHFIISENVFNLPKKLWRRFIEKAGMNKRFAELSLKEIAGFINLLQADLYLIEGKTTYKEEFVTCGGIPCDEVNFKTMESKICSGLYFAGEILDVDGITGGFNFQNAWTTGCISGCLR